MDIIEQLSTALTARLAAAGSSVVAVIGARRPCSGILWREDVVLTSEQLLGEQPDLTVSADGRTAAATLAGRDAGTNVAVLKLDAALPAAPIEAASAASAGALALVIGADARGAGTGRLAMVHAVGEAWHSMAGGRIDALIRLDCRLGADEGGPVLAADNRLLGMSTSGPRRRTIVIPTATLARVVEPLLAEGRITRGWLGVGLQPVMIPDGLRQAAGREAGLMVVGLSPGAPAEAAGVLPGDIVLDLDGQPVARPRALASLLGPDAIGRSVALRVLRAGNVHTVGVTVAARPAG
ncbi:MAG: serine protease [Proteobacteria bacterium]|nr:serine protease [Pseudomonadota bacterium]